MRKASEKEITKAVRALRGHMRDRYKKGAWMVGLYYGIRISEDGHVSPWWGTSEEKYNEKGVVAIFRPLSGKEVAAFLRKPLSEIVEAVTKQIM